MSKDRHLGDSVSSCEKERACSVSERNEGALGSASALVYLLEIAVVTGELALVQDGDQRRTASK